MFLFFVNKILLGGGLGFFNEEGGNFKLIIILFWLGYKIVDFIFLDFLNLIM